MEWAFLGSVFITLLVIIDPPGIIPIFLGLTAGRARAEVARLALQATATSLGVITGFAVLGDKVLAYLHISLPAMQGAGGLLLLLVALDLLTGKTTEPEAHDDVSIALVPLGVPLLAGPGAIVATILFARDAQTPPEMLALAAAIVLVHALLWAAMRYSVVIARILGRGGITVLTRISGVLLAAIAVQLIADAVRGFVLAG
ncbi:MAG: MarC family protein [Candidatus Nanopelagicales bacterium]|jgi:multiple antibiotic resistance protein|nr:MarC family protein [Candidatus Nanopelagicales bacterium]